LLHQMAVQHDKLPAKSTIALGDWKVLRLERTHSARKVRNIPSSNLDPPTDVILTVFPPFPQSLQKCARTVAIFRP
jgi:hypothetical protein